MSFNNLIKVRSILNILDKAICFATDQNVILRKLKAVFLCFNKHLIHNMKCLYNNIILSEVVT